MDKLLHLIVGAIIAGTPIKAEYAMGLVLVAAVGKEIYDHKSGRGTKDPFDTLATVAGGIPIFVYRMEF
jgi:hypothetical protein